MELTLLASKAELIVLPPPCPLDVNPADFSRGAELIERGYSDAFRYLDALDAGVATAPITLRLHKHP
jgi:NTE family protein